MDITKRTENLTNLHITTLRNHMSQLTIRKQIIRKTETTVNTTLTPHATQLAFAVRKFLCIELEHNVTRRKRDLIQYIWVKRHYQHPSVVWRILQLVNHISNLVTTTHTKRAPLLAIDIIQITSGVCDCFHWVLLVLKKIDVILLNILNEFFFRQII